MCTSTATLFYGLWVTTASLSFAATAHQRTRSPFCAIDLILLRRRSGSLKVDSDGANALVMMPPEVWGQVKQNLVLIEAHRAELKELDKLRCKACLEQDVMGSLFVRAVFGPRPADARADTLSFEVDHEWDQWSAPPYGCVACWDNIYDQEIDLLTTERIEVRRSEQDRSTWLTAL